MFLFAILVILEHLKIGNERDKGIMTQQDKARERAERIRNGMRTYIATLKDIADAYKERDWLTLDYKSWDDYVSSEFSDTRLKLSRDDRQKAVEALRIAGLTHRAIGSVLGVSKNTITKDVRQVSQSGTATQSSVVLPDRVQGLDGKSYPVITRRPDPDDVVTNEQFAKEVLPAFTPESVAHGLERQEARETEYKKNELHGLMFDDVHTTMQIAKKELVRALKDAKSIDFEFEPTEVSMLSQEIERIETVVSMFKDLLSDPAKADWDKALQTLTGE